MSKIKLFIKSIGYSATLTYKSSGIMLLLYFVLNIIASTLTLFSTIALKYVLDSIVTENQLLSVVLLWIGLYALSLVITQANTSIQNILHDSIFKKAEHLYERELAEKLTHLTLSIIDSSAGKDMIDDVRYGKNTAIYTTFRMVRIVSLLYTFVIAFATLVNFNVFFSLLFLLLTVPGIILNEVFDRKAEKLRREKAPDVRKFC